MEKIGIPSQNAIERPRTGENFARVNTPAKHKNGLQGFTGLYKGIQKKSPVLCRAYNIAVAPLVALCGVFVLVPW